MRSNLRYIIDGEGVIRYSEQGLPSDIELEQAIKAFGLA